MLGRHADAFFHKQSRERVVAARPNGDAQTIAYPDRELAGTGKVAMVRGQYEMPGPQSVVNANDMMPGMGDSAAFTPGIQPTPYINAKDMLPGMGAHDMMPGMGAHDMMPGMGSFDLKSLLVPGAIAAVAVMFLMRQRKHV